MRLSSGAPVRLFRPDWESVGGEAGFRSQPGDLWGFPFTMKWHNTLAVWNMQHSSSRQGSQAYREAGPLPRHFYWHPKPLPKLQGAQGRVPWQAFLHAHRQRRQAGPGRLLARRLQQSTTHSLTFKLGGPTFSRTGRAVRSEWALHLLEEMGSYLVGPCPWVVGSRTSAGCSPT